MKTWREFMQSSGGGGGVFGGRMFSPNVGGGRGMR